MDANEASELPAVVSALLNTLDDKNANVRKAVTASLKKLSVQYPKVVIHTAVYFWELHKKISVEHLISLLTVISDTFKQQAVYLDVDLASSVADLAVVQLTNNIQKEAMEVLVTLSRTHPTEALGPLLAKLEPGIMPDMAILRTIGLIIIENSSGVLVFLKVILNTLLPMTVQALDDITKQSFCFVFGKIAEVIGDKIRNAEHSSQLQIDKSTYKDEFSSMYNILTTNWLRTSKHYGLIESALTTLEAILPLLPEESSQDRISKLSPIILHQCKKPPVRLSATRVLAVLLEHQNAIDKETVRPFSEQIHHTLLEFITTCPFEASREALLTHFEALQCYRALVIICAEEELDRILQHLKSPTASQRARSLVLLKHLVNTLPTEANENVEHIALSLEEFIVDTACTRQIVAAIVALVARPNFLLTELQKTTFASYLISNCVTGNKDCAEALHLLATTVEGTERWLWPFLINALLNQGYHCTVHVPILQALTPLASKVNYCFDEIDHNLPMKILCRCLELFSIVENRQAVLNFLKCTAPIYGHNLQPYWDKKLLNIIQYCQDEDNSSAASEFRTTWDEDIVEILEESVKLEGEEWGSKLANELATKVKEGHIALFLGAICRNEAHIKLLVNLSHEHGLNEKFAKAVGISSKRNLDIVLKVMQGLCTVEDARKPPVKLLGLIKDTKGAAAAEAAKASLLLCYGEIAKRVDVGKMFPPLEKSVLPWIIRQLSDSKEISTKEAGLFALEMIANAIHPNNCDVPFELRIKSRALAVLLSLLQSPSGYRALPLYPSILKTVLSLIRVQPELIAEERQILISTVLDKVIAASSEMTLIVQPEELHRVTIKLGTICSEVVLDSADALAEFVEILSPWLQSQSSVERRVVFSVFRAVLRSYYNLLKYTFPSGKLNPGKLLGKVFPCCADPDHSLRPLVVDCITLTLNIVARHRSTLQHSADEDFSELKQTIVNDDPKVFYDCVKSLATAISEKVPAIENVSYAEGLIEALLYRGETGLAAGIALSRHFSIRGFEMSRTDVGLINNIILQMRHMENLSCRRIAVGSVRLLMTHHPEDVIEHLLSQPLPLDRGTEECWKEIGGDDELGSRVLQIILSKLDSNNIFVANSYNLQPENNQTLLFSSAAAIIALKCFLQTVQREGLIEKQLSGLLSVLFKYLAGWLETEIPATFASIANNKFGYVPNREGCKINLYTQAYSVLTFILATINSENISPDDCVFLTQEKQTEDHLITAVRFTTRCIISRDDVLSSLGQSLGKLLTSSIPAQRAVAAAFYAELVGTVDCGAIWLDAILNMLHEAKSDSSPTVRKLATIGLSRIAYLEQKQMDEYFDNCLTALLAGLEESLGEGGVDVILETLHGFSELLAAQSERPVSPQICLCLKPFVEKDNPEMRLAALKALTALAENWQKTMTLPNDEIADHLLGCLPCLTIRLEDSSSAVVEVAKSTLCTFSNLLQCDALTCVIHTHLKSKSIFNFEKYLCDLIYCLREKFPHRENELRNAAVRGYTRSENSNTRAAATLILGLCTPTGAEEVQRLLQLLHDPESTVRTRAAYALSYCFTR